MTSHIRVGRGFQDSPKKGRYWVGQGSLNWRNTGHALEIWICGCSLFYRRELYASKSASFNWTKSLEICGCKRWCPKDLRFCAPAAPALTHSLKQYIDLDRNNLYLYYNVQISKPFLKSFFSMSIMKTRRYWHLTYL